MARIYDNINKSFTQGLREIITNFGVKRVDFCVGYFNLRGWSLVENEIDMLQGDVVYEDDTPVNRTCRLLVGMQQPNEELISELYSIHILHLTENQTPSLEVTFLIYY